MKLESKIFLVGFAIFLIGIVMYCTTVPMSQNTETFLNIIVIVGFGLMLLGLVVYGRRMNREYHEQEVANETASRLIDEHAPRLECREPTKPAKKRPEPFKWVERFGPDRSKRH